MAMQREQATGPSQLPDPYKPKKPMRDTSDPSDLEVGFEIKDLKRHLEEFFKPLNDEAKSTRVGWFIVFREEPDEGKISELKLETLYFGTNKEGEYGFFLCSETAEFAPRSLKLLKKQTSRKPAKEELAETRPILEMTAAHASTKLSELRGYRRSVGVAFMDYPTLSHMYDVLTSTDEVNKLHFVFSGVEINYGEMSSPKHQHERYKVWKEDQQWDGYDPSICFSLKAELLVEMSEENLYDGGDLYYGSSSLPESVKTIKMPGFFHLETCMRYWQVVNSIGSYFLTDFGSSYLQSQISTESFKSIRQLLTPELVRELVEDKKAITI